MKRLSRILLWALVPLLFLSAFSCAFMLSYRRPCRKLVEQIFPDPPLVFAVIKAESGFRSDAMSSAGAVGCMQLLPSTAKFICEREEIEFVYSRLKEKEYNITLGCLYLNYLFKKFSDKETVLAAYNAGEGIVSEWLKNSKYSPDGKTLILVPYPETRAYVKKVIKYQKIYSIFR